MRTITIGADPELFLINPETGLFVSSIDRVGGSKAFPQSIGKGCAIQEDNVAVEFNTPPCSVVQEFIDSCEYTLEVLTSIAQDHGLGLSIIPSTEFGEDQLKDPRAQEFGCEPDFNAWANGAKNPRPSADNKALRSAGGHIHIGGVEDMDKVALIKAMDLFVGVPSVLFDTDTRRRSLYGNPGAFRPKPYGVEYRTPSNAWLAQKRYQWVFDQTHKAVKFVDEGRSITPELGEKIQRAIINSDQALAQEIMNVAY